MGADTAEGNFMLPGGPGAAIEQQIPISISQLSVGRGGFASF